MNSNIFSRARRRTAILTAMLIAIVAALGFAAGGFAQAGDAGTVPKHVGAAACAECHPRQTEQWRGSHHALAMQEAKEQTVLGDFSGIRFTHGGVASRFFRRDNRFFVNTDGPDGRLADFEIKFTFGVHPLQQYLIELPGGRLQALSIVWDARPRAEGGQRWYHLYPGERIKAGDPLHWTARSQNWNYMCAACHSTDLRKNYDAAADTFATRWSDINIACGACHGPGSTHVQWGRQAPASHAATPDKGLVKPSSVDANRRWVFAPGDRIAHRTGATAPGGVLDACFACHARRRQIVEPPIPGAAFLDNYAPTLLEAGAYHADGQIDGEVYEYGSFTQSKMHRAGVVCGDCHDPHSLRPKASGNALCAQCHRPDAFDVESHHGHKAGSAGSLCIDCHMPQKTYMGVDRRRDHGFRVPRPDMSVKHGLPNACGRCHDNRSAQWAAQAVARWRGKARPPALATAAFSAARAQAAKAGRLLAAVAQDGTEPAIVRATALRSLPASPTAAARASIGAGLDDADALVRAAAASAAARLDPREQARTVGPLLLDPVRLVRIEAARTLAGVPDTGLAPEHRTARRSATDELIASELAAAERPESHLNLADILGRMGRSEDAENELRQAMRLDPRFVPARVNLADLYRATRREAEAETLLREAIAIEPKSAEAYHALGLLKVRTGDRPGALAALAKAAALAPAVPRYAYVHGVALHDSGSVGQAMTILDQAHRRFPADQDLLVALAMFEHQRGRRTIALDYVDRLTRLDPESARIKALRQRIDAPGR
ncbi:MAG: tetratricopeptide repeat protein [Rhodocyclaceae bacterium]|nr:tetratricopeptide repeat protein [Rhodocyclaceae bacterium]